MFDFAWSEILIIGAVALVVIGPKDLPKALKTAGVVVRRMRGLAQEFHNSIDEMIREAELEDLRKAAIPPSRADIERKIGETIDPTGMLKEALAEPAPEPIMTPIGPVAPEPESSEPPPVRPPHEPNP